MVAVRVERSRITKKPSDTHISPILFNALVFSSSMHDRLFFGFKVYAMLEFLVEYSHPETPPVR